MTIPAEPWPCYEADERAAVERVLRSGRANYWTGNEGREFEREFAAFIGASHAIAVANGTVALELGLRAAGIGAGDEVVVPARTFVGTANAVVMCGATPVFADVDPQSQCVTVDTIEAALTPRSRAVIPVHLAGWPCGMAAIMELAVRRALTVIEDCAQAHGATLGASRVGSFGHAAAFSFCQDKIMSTGGEGGMLVTDDAGLWERAWAFKDHGKNYAAASRPATSAGFRWVHDRFGTNWRMTEMQSAIGRIQLRKLPGWLAARRAHADFLSERMSRWEALETTCPPPGIGHAWYRYHAFVRDDRLNSGWTRNRIIEALADAGAVCQTGSCGEVYRELAFREAGLGPGERLTVARRLADTSLAFPVHPTLSAATLERTCDAIDRVMRRCTR